MLTTSDYFHNFYISRCVIFIEKIAIADIIDLYFKYLYKKTQDKF